MSKSAFSKMYFEVEKLKESLLKEEINNRNLKYKNTVLTDALQQIANSDGWLVEPSPLCLVEEAHNKCVQIATDILKMEA